MSKISQKTIQTLIKKGRLVPIIKTNDKQEHFLVGYKRKNNRSSKSHESFLFPEPQKLTLNPETSTQNTG